MPTIENIWPAVYRLDSAGWKLVAVDFWGPIYNFDAQAARDAIFKAFPILRQYPPPELAAVFWTQPWDAAEPPKQVAFFANGWVPTDAEQSAPLPMPALAEGAALAGLAELYVLRDELPPDWQTRGALLGARLDQAAKFLDALERAFPNVKAPAEPDVGSVMQGLGKIASDAVEQIAAGSTELSGRAVAEVAARSLAGALAALWQVAADGATLYLGPEAQARELASVAGEAGQALLDGSDWRQRMGALQVVMDVAESGLLDKFAPPEASRAGAMPGTDRRRIPAAWLAPVASAGTPRRWMRRSAGRRAGAFPIVPVVIGAGVLAIAAAAVTVALAWGAVYFYKLWSRNKVLRDFCFDENGRPLPLRNGVCRALVESAATDLGPGEAETSWWEKVQYLLAGGGVLALVLLILRRGK